MWRVCVCVWVCLGFFLGGGGVHVRVFRACMWIYWGVYGLCIAVYPGMYRLIPGRYRFISGIGVCIVGYCCVSVCLSVCEMSTHSSRAGHLGDYELALLEEKMHGTQ
jgi:hypothetical protein